MEKLGTLLATILIIAGASASDFSSLGYSEETTIIPPADDDCTAPLYMNHDGSFENGYCWSYNGIQPPYYGAFGEAFDLGVGNIECIAMYLTQQGNFNGHPLDAYVWEGGVTAPPGAVISMVGGLVPSNIPFWPAVGQNDFEVGVFWEGEFTVGYWADFSSVVPQWFIAADLNGFGGFPWTNIAPGIGYPTGWNDPSIVWGGTQSLGFGVYFGTGSSPVEEATWGEIKSLFE